jgi:hypothetical protein
MSDNNQKEKYIIVKLSDAKLLQDWVDSDTEEIRQPKEIKTILKRFREEEGADILNIAQQLKFSNLCHACVIEGQQHSCQSLTSQKLGRRLDRLLQRAHGIIEPSEQSNPSPTPEVKKEPPLLTAAEREQSQVIKQRLANAHLQQRSANFLSERITTFINRYIGFTLDALTRNQITNGVREITENWRREHKATWLYPDRTPFTGAQFNYYVYFDKDKVTLETSPALKSLSEGTYEVIYLENNSLFSKPIKK